MRVHLKAVDEPATLSGREGDEPDPVRTGVEPRGLEVDTYHLGRTDLVGNRSNSCSVVIRVAAPVIAVLGYGNFGNRNNRSWSRDVLVETHIVADRCCRIVF